MPTQQKPRGTPQERKVGRNDQCQIFEAGGTHDKVAYSCTFNFTNILYIFMIFLWSNTLDLGNILYIFL
jgi:hypothetical protein